MFRKILRYASGMEKRLANLERGHKDFWDKLGVFMPLIQALLLASVGYYLTDSVNQTLRERELELSNVKEMRESLVKIYSPGVDRAELTASALALTAFGRYAVAPLIIALESGANQNIAAEQSLRALGTSRPDLVCRPVTRIVENRSQGYSVEALLSAVRLARTLDCREAESGIDGLRSLLSGGTVEEGLHLLTGIVSQPSPTRQNLSDLREAVNSALNDLRSPRLRQ
jgi:hypothetical protein